MPPQPSAEEIQQKERKELIQYAEGVAEEAKSYQQEIIKRQVDKKEEKELSKMGWEEKFVPEYAKGQFAPPSNTKKKSTMKLLKVMRRFVEKKMTSQKLTNSYLFFLDLTTQ